MVRFPDIKALPCRVTKRRRLIGGVTMLSASALLGGAAWACSCVNPGSAAAHLASSDVMIVARVSSTRRLPLAEGVAMAETRFAVSETIKGPVRRHWIIRHQRGDSAMCGVNFRPGQSYALLARIENGKVWSGACDQAFYTLEAYRAAAASSNGTDV